MREVERKTGISLSTLKESRNKQRKNSYLMRNKLGVESREKIIKLLENPLVFYELN